jgi:hypothetical protein
LLLRRKASIPETKKERENIGGVVGWMVWSLRPQEARKGSNQLLQFFKNVKQSQALMAQAYNPSFSRGRV